MSKLAHADIFHPPQRGACGLPMVGVGTHGIELHLGALNLRAVQRIAHITPADDQTQRHKEQELEHFGAGFLQYVRIEETTRKKRQRVKERNVGFPGADDCERQKLQNRNRKDAQNADDSNGGLIGLALEELVAEHGSHRDEGKQERVDPLGKDDRQQIDRDSDQRAENRADDAGQIVAVVFILLRLGLGLIAALPDRGGVHRLIAKELLARHQAQAVRIGRAGDGATVCRLHPGVAQGVGQRIEQRPDAAFLVLRFSDADHAHQIVLRHLVYAGALDPGGLQGGFQRFAQGASGAVHAERHVEVIASCVEATQRDGIVFPGSDAEIRADRLKAELRQL